MVRRMSKCEDILRNTNIDVKDVNEVIRSLLEEKLIYFTGIRTMISANGIKYLLTQCPYDCEFEYTKRGIRFKVNGIVKNNLKRELPFVLDVIYRFYIKNRDEPLVINDFDFRTKYFSTYGKIKPTHILPFLSQQGFFTYDRRNIILDSNQIEIMKVLLTKLSEITEIRDKLKYFKI